MTTTITLPVAVTKDLPPGGVEPCDARDLPASRTAEDQSAARVYASTLRGKHIAHDL